MAKIKNSEEVQGTEIATAAQFSDKLKNFEFVEEQEISALKELTGGEFLTLEPNSRYVFLATGFERKESKFSQDSDGMSDYAVLLDKSGNTKYCSQAVLVSTLTKIPAAELAQGVYIVVHTGEKVVGDKGSYLAMKVYRA